MPSHSVSVGRGDLTLYSFAQALRSNAIAASGRGIPEKFDEKLGITIVVSQ
ncbi:MAG: hypothetical protein KME28_00575 [Pelatocladus maniniholoensis HA4357-MV3]|uniref:Uncharacterized protein n=1 Tax=Pelatocladus maniniholoensis HA4357-MV3 TaxID=1117104 RepID=A0A9E3H3X8_9NOST|nr:hypothetical protein [Pelatocladus maniniholoensis HA4357-MV3]